MTKQVFFVKHNFAVQESLLTTDYSKQHCSQNGKVIEGINGKNEEEWIRRQKKKVNVLMLTC